MASYRRAPNTGKTAHSHPQGTHDDRFWALAAHASEKTPAPSRPTAQTTRQQTSVKPTGKRLSTRAQNRRNALSPSSYPKVLLRASPALS